MIRDYKTLKPKTSAFVQMVTRSGFFSGLSFKLTKEQDIRKTNYLSSVPSISFSFDYTKTIFDYNNIKNENDKTLIKALFQDLPTNTTFTVSQADFLIEDAASSADLSGTYKFIKLLEYAIVAEPISVTSINNRITIYENKYIKSIPQIGININPKSDILKYTITNSLLSNENTSFFKFGIYPNDFIKISGSLYNNIIFKILSLYKNSDGSETLIVDNELKDEVCFGTPLLVELFQSGPYNLIDSQQSTTAIGSCNLTFLDGSSSCYSNHTKEQCDVRRYEKAGVSNVWSENNSCVQNSVSLQSPNERSVNIPRKVYTTKQEAILSRAFRDSSLASNTQSNVAVD